MTPFTRRRVASACLAALLLVPLAVGIPSASADHVPPGPDSLDHFKCYNAANSTTDVYEFPRGDVAVLEDQFGLRTFVINRFANRLCNPVTKILPDGEAFAPINTDAHLVCYALSEPGFVARQVRVDNQFGGAQLTVLRPTRLCAPTWKNFTGQFPPEPEPPRLSHFLCYEARYSTPADTFELIPPSVTLVDQFGTSQNPVFEPRELCNPVTKTMQGQVTPALFPEAHLACFRITQASFGSPLPFTKNQFGFARVKVKAPVRLCLPSFKQEIL